MTITDTIHLIPEYLAQHASTNPPIHQLNNPPILLNYHSKHYPLNAALTAGD
jgi:hypothetical protein